MEEAASNTVWVADDTFREWSARLRFVDSTLWKSADGLIAIERDRLSLWADIP